MRGTKVPFQGQLCVFEEIKCSRRYSELTSQDPVLGACSDSKNGVIKYPSNVNRTINSQYGYKLYTMRLHLNTGSTGACVHSFRPFNIPGSSLGVMGTNHLPGPGVVLGCGEGARVTLSCRKLWAERHSRPKNRKGPLSESHRPKQIPHLT